MSSVAVLAALAIAVSGRLLERRDRERAGLAQARLVIAHLGGGSDEGESLDPAGNRQTKLGFTFENHSERPVLDVYAEYWTDDKAVTDSPAAVHQPIVEPGATVTSLALLMTGKAGEDFRMTTWRVRWTDSEGRQWYRDPSTALTPARLTGHSRAKP